jgi:hypothetical protein
MRVKKHPWTGRTGPAAEFIRSIDGLARTRSHRDVLADFGELAFCAYAGALYAGVPERSEALEARYMAIASERDPAVVRKLAELAAVAMQGVQAGGDFFGPIVGELGSLSAGLGQFFTPDALSELVARQTLEPSFVREKVDEAGYVTLLEPACGTAGMVLAAGKVMREHGFDPAQHLLVKAVDIDSFCIKFAWLQLAWSNIPAHVVHGDTLADKEWESTVTPAWVAFMAQHRGGIAKKLAAAQQAQAPATRSQAVAPQGDLFANLGVPA